MPARSCSSCDGPSRMFDFRDSPSRTLDFDDDPPRSLDFGEKTIGRLSLPPRCGGDSFLEILYWRSFNQDAKAAPSSSGESSCG